MSSIILSARTIAAALLATLSTLPALAFAFGEPYQQARFDALMQQGKPVLVRTHAPWCSTCRTQDNRLGQLFKAPENAVVTALEVSFDDQKDALQFFRVNRQSVLIAFKDGKEVGRLVGETRERPLAELLAKLR